jgi:rod shape-determining protein MreD
MKGLRLTGWLTIIITLLIAIILTLLPIPGWFESFRPLWVLLVLLYWAIALPHCVGIGIAWVCGLLLDVMQGTLLGEHALIYISLVYIAIKMHRQIRLFSLLGQAGAIYLLLFLNQLLAFWLEGLQGISVSMKWFWGAPLISAMLWPWIYMVLTDCIRRYRLN